MRKLCPNYDREDALDTVLEVPIPEEVFAIATSPSRKGSKPRELTYTTTWSRFARTSSTATSVKNTELQLLLGVVGAPLVPLPMAPPNRSINYSLKQEPIEMSTAKYIVRQYVAATGGEKALGAMGSMYAIGKVTMSASDLPQGCSSSRGGGKKLSKSGKLLARGAEMGGFLLWQKKPDLWCLELVVSGCKISAGSDGKVAWRQTPWQPPHASRGPPRPLRRALQGLDPLATANLFSSATCIGEKTVDGEGCYVLRLDADASTLRSRNTTNVDVLRHTVWGSFSHRTGLLVHLEDSHLLRVKSISSSSPSSDHSVYWETTMESYLDDYRPIDGVVIAHAGRTFVSLFRFGDSPETQTKTKMEETWSIEEIEFNVRGLSKDCFLPPADLKRDAEGCEILAPKPMQPIYQSQVTTKVVGQAPPNGGCVAWMGPTKVVVVEEWSSSSASTHDEEGDDDDDMSAPYPLPKVRHDSVVHPL